MLALGICLGYVLWAQGQGIPSSQFVPVTMVVTALLFVANAATVHQGTLVTQLVGLTLLAWWARALHRYFFAILVGLQIGWFLLLCVPAPGLDFGPLQPVAVGLTTLAGLVFARLGAGWVFAVTVATTGPAGRFSVAVYDGLTGDLLAQSAAGGALADELLAAVRSRLRRHKSAGRSTTPLAAATPEALQAALSLTPREAEILSWVVQGKTNPEIGIILGIQLTTVKKHLESTFAKLGVENRTGAVTLALEKISASR